MDSITKGLKIAITIINKENERFKKESNSNHNSWQYEQALSAIQQALMEKNLDNLSS